MKDEDGARLVDLKTRTKEFALRIIRLYAALPQTTVGHVIGKQLLRSGTSVGAQFREGTRSRSDAEFISKIEAALQELEETAYWLELIGEADVSRASDRTPARGERAHRNPGDMRQKRQTAARTLISSFRLHPSSFNPCAISCQQSPGASYVWWPRSKRVNFHLSPN